MTANNQLELKIVQDLTSGEVTVHANQPTTFNVFLRLNLLALKGLKDNIISNVQNSTKEKLIDLAFGDAFKEKAMQDPRTEEELKADVVKIMEDEMYDMLNLAVSNFLDTEFPSVNEKKSLTEQAAAEAGLDATASEEELVNAEKAYIENHPDLAAETVDLQPTEVKHMEVSSEENDR